MAWWMTFHTLWARSAFGNYSPPTHFNRLSEQGVGSLEGCIGLPALQPVPCLSGSNVGREGHRHLVYIYIYIKYTLSIGNRATWRNTPAPSSFHSLAALQPLIKVLSCRIWAFKWFIFNEHSRCHPSLLPATPSAWVSGWQSCIAKRFCSNHCSSVSFYDREIFFASFLQQED